VTSPSALETANEVFSIRWKNSPPFDIEERPWGIDQADANHEMADLEPQDLIKCSLRAWREWLRVVVAFPEMVGNTNDVCEELSDAAEGLDGVRTQITAEQKDDGYDEGVVEDEKARLPFFAALINTAIATVESAKAASFIAAIERKNRLGFSGPAVIAAGVEKAASPMVEQGVF
jgi:hypothetical protein